MPELSADKDLKVTMVLCDFAQVSPDGKMTIVGAFWTVCGPGPVTFFIAGAFEVPWQAANRTHRLRLDCVDFDGHSVMVPTPDGDQPLVVLGEFAAERPEDLRPGPGLPVPFVIPVGPVQLPPGGQFEWRLSIDGDTREDWRLPFSTRPEAEPDD